MIKTERRGESPLHRKIKEKIAEGLRELGYIADTEHRMKRGSFDVYALAPNGRNVAVEVYRTHAPSWMKQEAKVREFLVAQVYEEKLPPSVLAFGTSEEIQNLRETLQKEQTRSRELAEEVDRLQSLLKVKSTQKATASTLAGFDRLAIEYTELIPIERVAELLVLPMTALIEMIASGKLRAIRLPNSEWRIREPDLRKILRSWKPSDSEARGIPQGVRQ